MTLDELTLDELGALADWLQKTHAPEAYVKRYPGLEPIATAHTKIKERRKALLDEQAAADAAGAEPVLGSQTGPA